MPLPYVSGPSRRALLAAAGAAGATGAAGLVTVAGPAAASSPRRSAALVLHNARVFTGTSHHGRADAVAVGRDGRVLAVGTDAALRRYIGRDTDVVDARGGTVMSGVHDGHAHPTSAASRSLRPSLAGAEQTVEELRKTLTGFLKDSADQEPDGWLVVEDWNPVGLLPHGTAPHHSMLDTLPTRRPIVLSGGDGHNLWANQRALDIAQITASTPDPVGGKIVKGTDGKPTGVLKDDAQPLVMRHVPEPDETRLADAAAKILAEAAASGITTFMEAVVGRGELELYRRLAESDRLLQRFVPALRIETDQTKDPKAAVAYAKKLSAEFEDVRKLRFGTVKVFLDGVIEYPAQTAALLKPYLDKDGRPTDNRGDLYVSAADYGRLSAAFNAEGWQMHAHAIGDRAVRTSLDGYAYALRKTGRRDLRNTTAHLQLVDPADLPRFAALGVVACMQLQWAARNTWTMEALLPYIGAERHRWQYPARSLQKRRAALAGGSDWPVDPLQVWNQIRTAIDREGMEGGGDLYRAQEGLSRTSSLLMHTAGTARQLRMEHLTGSVERGKAADLVLLDRDVTRCPVADISSAEVRLTLVGGTVVHDAESSAGRAAAARVTRAAAGPRPTSYASVHGGRHASCGCG
ncbi:amidohydrolase [Streptomyces formicae]|uniref:Exoenzymes regulatory protein AepA in lipid-linked oligosaccharide synthesis cluster n=1 Tax=Streptomyces formicae TaxID=1616117 RepID=A0A291QI00_9ACTN|nr:amidohydrolase [Streptomyces formicae]ATL31147.1 Exoenzymes regulatory protein AepA in lipid-linked oligosaccharide synthesis cluster [Streptomyces formicae]